VTVARSPEPPGVLSGVRAVDLAGESGAYCARLLADLGAEVVKIEPPDGDPARRIGRFPNFFFSHYDANKLGAVIDWGSSEDRECFARLVETTDVLVITGTPGDLERRGLSPSDLARRWPRLVVVAISPFGQTGPRREWKSCDLVAQATGGMAFVNGHPGEAPLGAFGLQAYHSAGLHGAVGALLALLARRRTGRGQLVDVSLQEAVLAMVEHVSATFHETGKVEERRGTLHWTRTFRAARARDGIVLLSHLGDWTSLAEWLKADEHAQDLADPSWEDEKRRRDGCEHVFDVLAAWAAGQSVDDLVEAAQLRRLPFAAVRPLGALPANPQLLARGFFTSLYDERLGRDFLHPGPPFRMSATPWRLRRPAPRLGNPLAELVKTLPPWPGVPPFRKGGSEGISRSDHLGKSPSIPLLQRGKSLAGVRVLDLTWVVAGPAATRILADHGADVIKVERPGVPEVEERRGGLFGNLNRGKRSLAINLDDGRGLALLRDLVRQCDVVIDNFSPRVMENWGLDYESLRALRCDVIAIRMSGFGSTGPWRDRVSYGPTLQAEAGFTFHMRHPGGEPAGLGFSYSDMASGAFAALAALAALWHREQTGEGQLVDLSQFEALACMIGPALLEVLNEEHGSAPQGNASAERAAAPHGIYRCLDRPGDRGPRDRWCAIAVFSDDEWRRLVAALGSPAWALDRRFAGVSSRLAHAADLDRLVGEWTRRRSAEEVTQVLQAAGVAAGIVADAEDLCVRDPHLAARGHWRELESSAGDTVRLDGVTAPLSATPGSIDAPGPLRGEHTDQVLGELLGLDRAALDDLRRAGVIGSGISAAVAPGSG
jgi:crotonobetainyl-CoA:carnitine CoA-transferase CaiB-like acyl-CoA transferase